MEIYPKDLIQKARNLRSQGHTYTEIQTILQKPIPKSTLNHWLRDILLSFKSQSRIAHKIEQSGKRGLAIAWNLKRNERINLLQSTLKQAEAEFGDYIYDQKTTKLILAMLYWAEGGKSKNGRNSNEFVRFGNSDPKMISLFLKLFRQTFNIDERRLRGKIQCRADQNVNELQLYWSNLTNIPVTQFQKSFIDARTIGNPTLKTDYKGVFVLIYCSNKIFLELKYISDIIYTQVIGT